MRKARQWDTARHGGLAEDILAAGVPAADLEDSAAEAPAEEERVVRGRTARQLFMKKFFGKISPIPRNPSEILLLVVNLVPFLGVWLWGWKIFDILFLYLAETIIIGLFGLIKFAIILRYRKSRNVLRSVLNSFGALKDFWLTSGTVNSMWTKVFPSEFLSMRMAPWCGEFDGSGSKYV